MRNPFLLRHTFIVLLLMTTSSTLLHPQSSLAYWLCFLNYNRFTTVTTDSHIELILDSKQKSQTPAYSFRIKFDQSSDHQRTVKCNKNFKISQQQQMYRCPFLRHRILQHSSPPSCHTHTPKCPKNRTIQNRHR